LSYIGRLHSWPHSEITKDIKTIKICKCYEFQITHFNIGSIAIESDMVKKCGTFLANSLQSRDTPYFWFDARHFDFLLSADVGHVYSITIESGTVENVKVAVEISLKSRSSPEIHRISSLTASF